jgi:hypothetical protein
VTLDQRIEFLFKSTESLHATAQEQTAQLQEHTKQLELDAENIRGLVRIAEIRERRLSGLEGGGPPPKGS